MQNCRAWIVLEKILVVNTTSHESRLLRRKKVQPKSYPLFGLIATVFNFCFSPCSTIRDYLEEGSTSLPFYFTPIWQVKLVTIISINDLSFFSEYAKNCLLTLSHVSFMCVGWSGCGNLITSCWKISKAHGDKMTTELSPSRFLRETRLSKKSYEIITKLASQNKWSRRYVCFFKFSVEWCA